MRKFSLTNQSFHQFLLTQSIILYCEKGEKGQDKGNKLCKKDKKIRQLSLTYNLHSVPKVIFLQAAEFSG